MQSLDTKIISSVSHHTLIQTISEFQARFISELDIIYNIVTVQIRISQNTHNSVTLATSNYPMKEYKIYYIHSKRIRVHN